MESRHRVSPGGVALIKRFEGFRARAARLLDGRHVIGYGHTRSARAGAEIGEADADALLRFDLQAVEGALDELVFTPLNRNQTDALAAFAFSVGVDAFRRSNVLRRVNEGDLLGAAAALESWRRAEFEGEPIVVDALIRRRAAEKLLFLTPVQGFIAAPSAVLKPELDYAALPPRSPVQAAEIVSSLDGEEAGAERLDEPAPPAAPSEPSPAQIAAENVSRRLQALFADEPQAAGPAASADDRPPELSADLALAGAPQAEPEPEPEPVLSASGAVEAEPPLDLAEPTSAAAADDDVLTLDHADRFDRRIARSEPEAAFAPPPAERESRWPYLALGALSLGLFALALTIILRAQGLGEDLLGPRTLMGIVLAVIGTVGVCTAVYFWLRTLAGGEAGGTDGDDRTG